jgi:hypothetical protein
VDGGSQVDAGATAIWINNAVLFLVDQANHGVGVSGSGYLDAVLYGLNNVEKMDGATFIVNEAALDGGNYPLSGYGNDVTARDLAVIFGVGQAYLTSTQRATAVNKLINDISDPSPCTKTLAVPHDTLATGTAQAGSATTITLAAGDSAANGFYVNNIINATVGGAESDGLVTAYNSTTKVATVGSWSGGIPTTGTVYAIYSTITIGTAASGATATITGYNTNFAADVASGDTVYGINPPAWGYGFYPGQMGSWVTGSSTIGATSITNAINSAFVQASTTVPQVYYRAPKWTAGRCGYKWLHQYWSGGLGSQPATYPVRGGQSNGSDPAGGTNIPVLNSNNYLSSQGALLTLFLALSEFDSRAITNVGVFSTGIVDYGLAWQWNYMTGFTSSGANYGINITAMAAGANSWDLAHNLVGFPDVGLNGPFTEGISTWKTYAPLPDNPYIVGYGRVHQVLLYGGAGSSNPGQTSVDGQNTGYLKDFGSAANPTAQSSQFLKNYMASIGYNTVGSIPAQDLDKLSVLIDPRIVSTDYKTQPLQYFFGSSASSQCSALTWWSCPSDGKGTAFLSRTSWTDPSATMLQFQGRGFGGDHDSTQPGDVQIWKVGPLLASDWIPIGDSGTRNNDVIGSSPEFGGATSFCPGIGYSACGSGNTAGLAHASITRWAAANHGAWTVNYGDQASRYAYALASFAGSYQTVNNHVLRHLAHFKKAGAEEIVIQYDDIDTANSPTQIAVHTHYPQNGETVAGNSYVIYDEGSTSCPGSGGCGSLDTNRTILEQQNGIADAHGDPTPQYNLISKFVVPGGAPAVFMHYDGTAYTGANAHTDRISICADSGSTGACGASGQNGLELIQVHKVATQPDTSLTTTALNPDVNWAGVQTTDKVVLFARHGTTYSTIAGFTTTHSGTAQYLFAGLTPGTYTVTVGGSGVSGSPFTVAAGDNSIYFESTSGVVSINGSVVGGPPTAGAMTSAGSLSSGGRR